MSYGHLYGCWRPPPPPPLPPAASSDTPPGLSPPPTGSYRLDVVHLPVEEVIKQPEFTYCDILMIIFHVEYRTSTSIGKWPHKFVSRRLWGEKKTNLIFYFLMLHPEVSSRWDPGCVPGRPWGLRRALCARRSSEGETLEDPDCMQRTGSRDPIPLLITQSSAGLPSSSARGLDTSEPHWPACPAHTSTFKSFTYLKSSQRECAHLNKHLN